jgi:CMP-N-acetylneuraminic acid synthetase
LNGKPLYSYILETLLECPEVVRIVVDTDSPIIMSGVSKAYPSVQLIERPEHLRGDFVAMNAVLLHDVKEVMADFYLQTHSTNPLLKSRTISHAVSRFFSAYPQNDSLFSVSRLQTRLWNPAGKPINHDPMELIRTQDLPPVYEENSCIYIFERDRFMKRGNRLGEKPQFFEIEALEALDIDEEIDFKIAECVIKGEG